MQRVIPYLTYADAPRAMRFLREVFGFSEVLSMPMPDGRIGHAELQRDDTLVYLASEFELFGTSPTKLQGTHTSLMWRVDDVDAHYRHAEANGATIVSPPLDEHGQRGYRALDCEGHRWTFFTPLPERSS